MSFLKGFERTSDALFVHWTLLLTSGCRLELEYSKTPGVHDIIVSLLRPIFPDTGGDLVRWSGLRLSKSLPHTC